jgi:hypothetical protein
VLGNLDIKMSLTAAPVRTSEILQRRLQMLAVGKRNEYAVNLSLAIVIA